MFNQSLVVRPSHLGEDTLRYALTREALPPHSHGGVQIRCDRVLEHHQVVFVIEPEIAPQMVSKSGELVSHHQLL
ncbi:hypothetical protein D3C80_1715150 [compost metagenome]